MIDKILMDRALINFSNSNFVSGKSSNYIYKFLYIVIIFFFLYFLINFFFLECFEKKKKHIAVVEIGGIISEKNNNAKNIIFSLNDAFKSKHAKVIILKLNSPGGSPVQSSIIYDYIIEKKKYINKPVYAIIEDVGASASYLIALSADRIYCSPFSIVGSIGAIFSSFGFNNIIQKLGIERRIYKSNKYKVIMDPFLEIKKEEEKILQNNVTCIYDIFSHIVKNSRDFKYDNVIFSGKFWIGLESLKFRLVDGFYDINSLSNIILKIDKIVYYNVSSSMFNLIKKIKG